MVTVENVPRNDLRSSFTRPFPAHVVHFLSLVPGFAPVPLQVSQVEVLPSTTFRVTPNTLSSKDFSQYGVHFEEQKVVLFKGAIFTEPNSNNKEVKISSPVEIYNISLNGGGSNVVFQKLTGKTNEYGTISFQSPEISGCLPGAPSIKKIITIQSSGSFSY